VPLSVCLQAVTCRQIQSAVTSRFLTAVPEVIHLLYMAILTLFTANKTGRACGTHGRGEKIELGFGGEARRKWIARKTKVLMGGWDQNGY
jgi:hypothetical protein